MKIYSKALLGVTIKTIILDAMLDDSIEFIKQKIQKETQIVILQQRLIFNNVRLEDDKTLADYKIENGSTLRLVLELVGGGFSFASFENLRKEKLSEIGPDHLAIKKRGLQLIGYCKNHLCEIFQKKFLTSIGFGIFDAEFLESHCICPKCLLQFDHISVSFYKCFVEIDGENIQGQIKHIAKQVDDYVIEDTKPGVMWKSLIIKVSMENKDKISVASILDDEPNVEI